ncbi:MAG: phosphopantetheine adenylyltransferase [Blastocatellia bacterium]|nr:phosphopantetheine adenylyltransferase [Blastocatellia bacterium]
MRYLVSAMLIVVGLIHLLPVPGVLGSETLARLYGISCAEPNLAILMRHRAVLFGVLGLFFMFAAVKPAYQPAAFGMGFVSVVSFLWLAWSVGGYNTQVGRVFMADVVALLCLGIGGALYVYANFKRG